MVENAGCGMRDTGSVENAESVENAGWVENVGSVENAGRWKTRGPHTEKRILYEQGACLLENCSLLKRVFFVCSLQPTSGFRS